MGLFDHKILKKERNYVLKKWKYNFACIELEA